MGKKKEEKKEEQTRKKKKKKKGGGGGGGDAEEEECSNNLYSPFLTFLTNHLPYIIDHCECSDFIPLYNRTMAQTPGFSQTCDLE